MSAHGDWQQNSMKVLYEWLWLLCCGKQPGGLFLTCLPFGESSSLASDGQNVGK